MATGGRRKTQSTQAGFLTRIEAVGWRFFLVAFILLIGPGIYFSFSIMREEIPWVVPAGLGLLVGAFAAALVTWALNEALQRYHRKRRLEARKKAKKR